MGTTRKNALFAGTAVIVMLSVFSACGRTTGTASADSGDENTGGRIISANTKDAAESSDDLGGDMEPGVEIVPDDPGGDTEPAVFEGTASDEPGGSTEPAVFEGTASDEPGGSTEPGVEIVPDDPGDLEQPAESDEWTEAVYLGVEHYGAENVNKDTKNDFRYCFEIYGNEEIFAIDNGTQDAAGKYDYPMQNLLKEGYVYEIREQDGQITAVREVPDAEISYQPPVVCEPGKKTLHNFLAAAMEPVGTTLYIYGGGWDWQDEGSSIQACTIGVSADWVRFFRSKDVNYTYRDRDGNSANKDAAHSYYPYGGYNEYYYAGLDCSGYLGWVLYNTMRTESGGDGYVGFSTGFAKRLSGYGWGDFTQNVPVPDGSDSTAMKPGDIMSISGHVWISFGTCADGSIVIAHSTPGVSRTGQPGSGVQLAAIGSSESCEAYRLADFYMSNYFPEWYARYRTALKDAGTYFAIKGDAGRFRWNLTGESGGLTDPDGYAAMRPAEILADLFGI